MFALAAGEDASLFEFDLPGKIPEEKEILALVPNVMPSAVPAKAEVEAWNRLSRDEQLTRMRAELSHPDCAAVTDDTLSGILARAEQEAAQHPNG